MKSLCLFASYFSGNDIPYYITVYLKELKNVYGEVIFLTTQKELSKESSEFLKDENLISILVENKGFDFGQWYQAIQKINLLEYDQVAFVNDSCILFRSLEGFALWAAKNQANVKGITHSDAIFPHIQSYFFQLDKKALTLTEDYFEKNKILNTISEVITTYEVGLSEYLQNNGMTIAAYIDNNGYSGEFSPYYRCIDYHLSKGIPMIKKKVIFSSYRKSELLTLARMNFNCDPIYYLNQIIRITKDRIIDIERIEGVGAVMTQLERMKYNAWRLFYKMVRPLNKFRKAL